MFHPPWCFHLEPSRRRVGGWELFGLGGLHDVRPLGQLKAALAFQVLREGRNELLRLHVLSRDVKRTETSMISMKLDASMISMKLDASMISMKLDAYKTHTYTSIYLLPTCMRVCIHIVYRCIFKVSCFFMCSCHSIFMCSDWIRFMHVFLALSTCKKDVHLTWRYRSVQYDIFLISWTALK